MKESGKSAWAHGQYSFRGEELRSLLGARNNGKGRWGWVYEMTGDYALTKLIASSDRDDETYFSETTGPSIGYLDILKKDNKLEVTYSAGFGYMINDLHLWVGCTLEDLQQVTKDGKIVPGNFPYSYDEDPTSSYTFEIDLNVYNCADRIFTAAYAGMLYTIKGADKRDANPTFDIVDLGQYGLVNATDINDKSQVVGENLLWDQQAGLTDMGDLSARSINDNTQVVGQSASSSRISYYWDQASGLIPIDTLDYSGIESRSRAYDINDFGTVVGEVDYYDPEDADYEFYSLIWKKGDGLISHFEAFSTAYSLNEYNQIAGAAVFYPSPQIYLYRMGELPQAIGPFQGYSRGEPTSINNSGQVVGSIDLIQQNSEQKIAADETQKEYQNLPRVDKLLRLTNTAGIYDFGHVAEMLRNSTFEKEAFPWLTNSTRRKKGLGKSRKSLPWNKKEQKKIIEAAVNSNYHSAAFVWDQQNGLHDLGTLGGDWSTAWDINDHGQVVGYSSIAPGIHRAFYWDEDHGMIELPTLGGNSLARAINNKGQIVGYSYDSNGHFHPVMWTISPASAK